MAGFNIQDFRSELFKRGGVLPTNRFLITLATPQILINNQLAHSVNRKLEFWCEAAQVPGYQLQTGEVRRWGYGPIEKRPHNPNFQQLSLQFLSDGNGEVWQFFQLWLERILPHNTMNGFNSVTRGRLPYELLYKQQYASDVSIVIYRPDGKPIKHVVCTEAFPVHVTPLRMNWGDTNDIVRFGVVMEYLDWHLRYREAQHGWPPCY